MTEDLERPEEGDGAELTDPAEVLTGALYEARTGLRSNVADLLEVLGQAELLVPLAEPIPGVALEEVRELDSDLSFRPHLLGHPDGSVFAVAYSEPGLVERVRESLGWKTAGGELEFVRLPALVALGLGQSRLGDVELDGLVLNAGDESELVLARDEVGSLLAGRPLPLVGYVAELERSDLDDAAVVEGAEPPPEALLLALDAAVAREPGLSGYSLKTTFDPERDREPHLTLTLALVAGASVAHQELAERVMQEAGPLLPPPGYADVVFRDVEA
jgi:hypothetical protein